MRHFLRELPRRRVVQAALAYAVGAWVIIEVSSVILPAFEAPGWALQLVIALCVVGFPVVLVVSWVFDLTPSGFVRTDEAGEGATETTGSAAADAPDSDTQAEPVDDEQAGDSRFAERRQITVLRYLLHCRGDDGEELDPEVLREILPGAQRDCAEIVGQYNGHLAWSHQNESEAYFGYPMALEHDARSAVRCAMELRDRFSRADDGSGARIGVGVAVHTGIAIAEADQGSADHAPVTGEFSKVAGRLLDRLPPGDIAVSSTTRTLVQDYFDLEPCAETGAGESAYLVKQELDSLVYRSSYILAAERLLGRDHEIGILKDRWERAESGSSQTVSVVGEAGIGKSALVGAVIEYCARRQEAVIAECYCTPFNRNVALYPIKRLLRRSILSLDDHDGPQAKLAVIEQFFTERGLPLEENVPLLARFLAVPLDDRYAPPALSPEQIKDKTLELIIQLLLHRARSQPVLLVVEDLHWSDATTLELIGRIIDYGPDARLLVLLTYRPELDTPWSTRTDITHLSLGSVTPSQAAELVRLASGESNLPDEIADKIVKHSDGVPLFLEELTKAVLEAAADLSSYEDFEIPLTLQDTLTARLDRLGGARRTAQMAAVFGREFSFEWLAALSESGEQSLENDLKVLVASGLAYQRGTRGGSQYIFKHVLIQDAACQSLLRRDRQEIHRRVATLFSERFAGYGETHPQVVAFHYASAGDNERAIPLYIKAGKDALSHSAYQDAVNQLQAGLDLVPEMPPGAARDALELELQASLGRAMTATRGYAAGEVEERWLRACELATELGQTGIQVGVTMGLWQCQISQGRLHEALQQADGLLQLAQATGQPDTLLPTQTAAGITRFHVGELEAAEDMFEQVVSSYDIDRHGDLALTYGQDPCVTCLAWHGVSSWLRGQPAQARERVSRAVSLARRIKHPFTLAYALRRTIPVLYYAGDTESLLATIGELHQIADENSFAEVRAQVALWRLIAEGGDTGARADDMLARSRQSGAALNLCYSLGLLAEMDLRSGNPATGRLHVDTALATAERSGERWCIADLHRLSGDLCLAIDKENTDPARAAYQRAIDCAREQGAGFFELRARLGLGRLYYERGDSDQAASVLAPAADLITGDDVPDLSSLAGLQRELRARASVPGTTAEE